MIEIDNSKLGRIAHCVRRKKFGDRAKRQRQFMLAKYVAHRANLNVQRSQCPVRARISVQPFIASFTVRIWSLVKKSSSFTRFTGYCGRMKSCSKP